ncbi:MAG: GTP-binding protein YchF [Candidatus Jorgensenbacteria bacterium GW2011_GWA1_48_13]|uniref:GTP-binding protein YchF n=1 Tax=Candidatus Jorgensenbacteria bacterium GW2011_GWB1_50_10 TaxID=1618665 RepID=A0A0G1W8F0_9BACT|nr:MAG: GTP-binding protein YchF [Candidatus Jorgensenbacteria bacterium GW2011_GWA1_48_13]KKW15081.1 MAG: GTP-binding protein YchF [Candidatus Jorgensenbacteria bacterium GW2011_GWB1_50_10]
MKLSIGIVGLPNVGKSTLFKIITKQEVNIANYPFATIDPNIGVVPVPDERLQKLTELSRSKKTVPAVVEFYDIAGLVKGAHKGEGLGNQFLTHIREVNAVLQVVRCFKESEIIHVEGGVNPLRDVETIKTELALKDLETVQKRLEKAEADARSGNKEFVDLKDALEEIKAWLEEGKMLTTIPKEDSLHWKILKELNLLTAKPQLYLLNGREEDVPSELITEIKETGAGYVVADLSSAETIPELIRKAYEVLNLISFFTTGEDESRAWTCLAGTKAPQAAGVIHSDFQEKFIRAEVVKYEKLVEAGGWNEAKQKGWLRLEGKDYEVQDGDVIVVRHG